MEPLTLTYLVIRFANAFVDRAGSRTADLVFNYVQGASGAGANPASAIETNIRRDPGFGNLVADAINGDALRFTADAAKLVYSEPGLVQAWIGISDDHAKFAFRGQCPIGGEFLFLPPKYLMPDGVQVSSMTLYPLMKKKSVLMRAQCRSGHAWLVFPVVSN